jgi:predicted RNA polymerase sigma factor
MSLIVAVKPDGKGHDLVGRPRWTRGAARDGRLPGYRYLPAAQADLLRRLDRPRDAAKAYRAALELANNLAERHFLAARLVSVVV